MAIFSIHKWQNDGRQTLSWQKLLCTIGLCVISLYPPQAVEAAYYRWVDDKGVVHFSDHAPEISNAIIERFSLAEIEVQPNISPSETPTAKEEAQITANRVQLLSPADQSTFRSSQGSLTIEFKTDQPLTAQQDVTVFLDGKAVEKARQSPITLDQIDRGAHQIQLKLSDNQKVISTSASIDIFMHRPIDRQSPMRLPQPPFLSKTRQTSIPNK